jgi:hypothetical protein
MKSDRRCVSLSQKLLTFPVEVKVDFPKLVHFGLQKQEVFSWNEQHSAGVLPSRIKRKPVDRYQKQLDKLEKPYREDKYGGKTPEETFDLFISALKKEDTCPAVRKSLCGIDLASKYFTIPKQESWLDTLREYKDRRLLANLVDELDATKKIWKKSQTNPDIIEFYSYTNIDRETIAEFNGQKLAVPAGKYSSTTRFEKYPSGIWKISLL